MNTPAQQQDTTVLLPVGRIVQGDLYTAQDKDMQGNKLITKTGDNAGKERVNFFFAVAVPKTPGVAHWSGEQWGAKVWALIWQWWPQGQAQNPLFATKIEDGDSTIPNQGGRKNFETEGYPGHWIVKLGSGFAPKIFDEQGAPLLTPGLVKRGYWVEVLATLDTNNNIQKPGIYINHTMVAYRAPGKEISSGPDPRAVGFGRSALPAGVTAQPLQHAANMPSQVAAPGAPPAAAYAPQPPAAYAPPGAPPPPAAYAQPTAAPPPPQPVVAAPAFLHPPVSGAAPPPPPAPSMAPPPSVVCPLGAPMGYKMANLNGQRYEAWKASGWNDQQLVDGRHMVRL